MTITGVPGRNQDLIFFYGEEGMGWVKFKNSKGRQKFVYFIIVTFLRQSNKLFFGGGANPRSSWILALLLYVIEVSRFFCLFHWVIKGLVSI